MTAAGSTANHDDRGADPDETELKIAELRWRAEFSAMGKAQRGGSGWVLLSCSARDGKLVNQWAMDHSTTVAGGQPVLALDMYEHSYHIDYGANAASYVDAFMAAINWPAVGRAFGALRSWDID